MVKPFLNTLNQTLYVSYITGLTGVIDNNPNPHDNKIPGLAADSGLTICYVANSANSPVYVALVDGQGASVAGGAPLPIPAGTNIKTQTLINKTFSAISNGATLYTVTTGKTFYCLGYRFSCGSSTNKEIQIKLGSTIVTDDIISGSTQPQPAFMNGAILFSAPSAQAITIAWTGSATDVYGMIYGYEM